MLRAALASLLLLLCVACSTAEPRSHQQSAEPELVIQSPEQPGPDPRVEPIEGDPCDPLPKAGDPCPPGASWCVLDWGEPCGASTALRCREGVWQLEQEANLCEDES